MTDKLKLSLFLAGVHFLWMALVWAITGFIGASFLPTYALSIVIFYILLIHVTMVGTVDSEDVNFRDGDGK